LYPIASVAARTDCAGDQIDLTSPFNRQ
jgi:hypothetical protein